MDFKDTQTIYMQIADYFCEKILLKKWNANERIPSVRDIAVALEVNPNTALRAFVSLQENGVIYNKRGIGYFVCTDGYDKALKLKRVEFIEKEAPAFIKKMQILKFTCEEIEKIIEKSPEK